MNQKDKIIEVTIQLINENGGDISKVTARKIAERAQVGLGLINYHFGSKDTLITECVQKIISNVIGCFQPQNIEYSSDPIEADKERLTYWASQVFEFLYANKSVSAISILGDMKNNLRESNTLNTQIGFEGAIKSDISEARKNLILFMLVSSMQEAFLQDNLVLLRLGLDMQKKEDRGKYVKSVVDLLFGGIRNE